MVEYTLNLDSIFGSLADPTRRDILARLARQDLSISQIAESYDLTFAAISKHLQVLEKARLVMKRRRGKEQIVSLSPAAIKIAEDYLQQYATILDARFDALERYLDQMK